MSLAIVTGGSRGIGAAIAEKLAQDGFDVLINCASSVEKAEAVAEKCRAHGVNAYVKKWDCLLYTSCLSQPIRSVRYRSATQVGYFQQAQHTRVAQFVSPEVTDSTYAG